VSLFAAAVKPLGVRFSRYALATTPRAAAPNELAPNGSDIRRNPYITGSN
jgi:hypothetical protein